MGTSIRPELSVKNKYWVEKHRYHELKHFCMQYHIWKKAYLSLDGMGTSSTELLTASNTGAYNDPTAKCVEARMFYSEKMEMVEKAAEEADKTLSSYILKGVTEGVSYDCLKARLEIPCCKDTYYEAYRRFFWILDRLRG